MARGLSILLFFLLGQYAEAAAQGLPALLTTRIDSVFAPWDTTEKPGMVVAILRDGEAIYQQAFGMANIRKAEALAPRHRFWVASMTKQFTAASIALLAESGKLHAEDDIRKYLPELPFLGDTIRIMHLVHHTSGLRDGFVLLGLQLKGERRYTNHNVLEVLQAQRSLNFRPGTRFEYNNSGYVLLAEIVARVSGQPFPDFVRQHIFAPLGMHDSEIRGEVDFASTDRLAVGYRERRGRYRSTRFKGNTYGSTGLVTTVADLSRWDANFYANTLGKGRPDLIRELTTPAVLQDGTPIPYAYGLEVTRHKGLLAINHFGADPGYKADMIRFPEKHLTFICLSNSDNNYNLTPRLLHIADWVLGLSPEAGNVTAPAAKPGVERLAGYYLNTQNNYFLQHISDKEGELFAAGSLRGYQMLLEPIGPGAFQNKGLHVAAFSFSQAEAGDAAVLHYSTPSESQLLHKLEPVPLTKQELERYSGNFYSPELSRTYRLRIRRGKLGLVFFGLLHVPLQPLEGNRFLADFLGNNCLVFTPDATAFTFNREGISNLSFTRKP